MFRHESVYIIEATRKQGKYPWTIANIARRTIATYILIHIILPLFVAAGERHILFVSGLRNGRPFISVWQQRGALLRQRCKLVLYIQPMRPLHGLPCIYNLCAPRAASTCIYNQRPSAPIFHNLYYAPRMWCINITIFIFLHHAIVIWHRLYIQLGLLRMHRLYIQHACIIYLTVVFLPHFYIQLGSRFCDLTRKR